MQNRCDVSPDSLPVIGVLAAMDVDPMLAAMETSRHGLTSQEAAQRLGAFGPNAVRSTRSGRW